MNRKVTECDIVLELLPLYIEEKTGEVSDAFVAEHLTGCRECREVYEFMSADLMPEAEMSREDATREVKRGRKRLSPTLKKVLFATAGILAYLGLMVGLVVYTYMYLTGM